MSLIEKAKAVASQQVSTTVEESKTIKYNTCLSDDQDSDTIKFEDAINDSEATMKKRHLAIEAKASKLKESQSSAGVIISSTEIAEEEKKEELENSDEVRTTKEGG